MARSFSSSDAKKLSEEHIKLKNSLSAGAEFEKTLHKDIGTAVSEALDKNVLSLLKTVPVDELNRDKCGFRIKALVGNGYSTVADVINASAYRLEMINGISAEGAKAIKAAANKIAAQAKAGAKLRISTDNKTPEISAVILALHKYLMCFAAVKSCRKLLALSGSQIEMAVSDLSPATGSIRWLFASSQTKAKAENAYRFLSEVFSGSYGDEARSALYTIDSAKFSSISEAWADFSDNPIIFFNTLEDICPGVLGTDDPVYGLPEELAKEVADECFYPDGLRCTLRRYQEWGVKYILHQEKVLLGDEMGLGKTVQAIASMVSLKNTGATHFIVVCPASVLTNWCREIKKMSSLPVVEVHGSSKSRSIRAWEESGGVAVTTYETTAAFSFEDEFKFDMLVVDEADECFYPDGLRCTLRRYQEWGVKYILHQEKVLLGDEMGLGKTVQAIASMVSLKNTGATHFIVVCPASVLTNWCREIKKMSSLPVVEVHGSSKSRSIRAWEESGGVAVTTYETTAAFSFEDEFKFDMLVVDEAHYIKNPEARRSMNVRKLCTKADRILFMTGTALENNVDEMISLMSVLQPKVAYSASSFAAISSAPQFRNAIAPVYYRRRREDVLTELPELIESEEWCTLLPSEKAVYEETLYTNNYAAVRRVSWNAEDLSESCKAIRLKEIVEDAAEDGRKIIVFSFFLDTIQHVKELFGDKCVQPINGSVSPSHRQEIIDEFEKAPAGTILPAQIQSGGTGLNIQSASVVIICEPQFKPSIENQAISRAYRMGQTRNVLVYRLLCENTVDERLMDILKSKQAAFDAFADESAAAAESVEIDSKSFGNIIKEEIDRINKEHQASEAPEQ